MTKEELIGRKFKDNIGNHKDIVYTITKIDEYDALYLSWVSPIEGKVEERTLFSVSNANLYIKQDRWTLLPEENKIYKTPKGIEYGVGTQFYNKTKGIEDFNHTFTICEKVHNVFFYVSQGTYSKYNICSEELEQYLDTGWWIIKQGMKDYKQVDPKTITFDFTNTKIKVNNADESKWVQEVAFNNSIAWGSGESRVLDYNNNYLYFEEYNKKNYYYSNFY